MAKIQIRRGTAATWTSQNPTLAAGELGFETDTGKIKVGDGSTVWTSLGYFGGGDLVDDTTPQLGGTLDTNAFGIQWSKGADVASATELLVLTDGNYFDVTGTTTIATIEDTADAWKVGSLIILQFDGILTLTHSADLSLPTAANITTAAGDIAFFQKVASGDWKCVVYQRADGTPLAGGGGSFLPLSGGTMTGAIVPADHDADGTIAEVVPVTFGTGSPPTASSTPIGTLFVQYQS